MAAAGQQYDPNNIPGTYCIGYLGYNASPYNYHPSLAAGIIFCILFGLSFLGHTVQSIRVRRWWQLTFAVGSVAELLGWAGRAWSSRCPYESTPFLIQISTLIFAPAFFTAGTYIILGRLINLFGPGVSPLKPVTYLYIFCTIDLVSLIMQAVGGGIAASSLTDPGANIAPGNDLMIAGIVFQLASILVFTLLGTYVLARARKMQAAELGNARVRYVIAATAFSVLCVVVRGIFRTIEMLQGWTGYLHTTERYFVGLDGVLMVCAVVVFNFVDPGWSEGGMSWGRRSSLRTAADGEKGVGGQGGVSESECTV